MNLDDAVPIVVDYLKAHGARVAFPSLRRLPDVIATDSRNLLCFALVPMTQRGDRNEWLPKETVNMVTRRFEHVPGTIDVYRFRADPSEAEARPLTIRSLINTLRLGLEDWRIVVPGRTRPNIVAIEKGEFIAVSVHTAGPHVSTLRHQARMKTASYAPRWGRGHTASYYVDEAGRVRRLA